MEQQVLDLLKATTVPDTDTIKKAEQSLLNLYPRQEFPFALLNIAVHKDVDGGLRKAALTTLRKYVDASWSSSFEEASLQPVDLPEDARKQIRSQILAICTSSDSSDDTGQNLAANIVSKIASADFPEEWPELFPHLVSILNANTSPSSTLGSLRVLYELVDSGLSDDQFFGVASDLVNSLKQIVLDTRTGEVNQAMALRVLGCCFDNLEQVLATEHARAVKAFLDEAMPPWMTFFMNALRQPLPSVSPADFTNVASGVVSKWKGIIAVKIQVIQMLVKVKKVYTPSLTPHVFELFQIIWQDLNDLFPAYTQLFIDRDSEGKLVDGDGLSYTLDALIIEAVDFLSSILKAKAVRSELNKQTKQSGTEQHKTPWLQQLLRVMTLYSRIPMEEEEMWQLDANIYLSETTSQTANYTPRSACAELVTQTILEWLNKTTVHALIFFNAESAAGQNVDWKEREASIYILNQTFKEVRELSISLEPESINLALQQISPYVHDGNAFLKGAAHLALSSLFAVAPSGFEDSARQSMNLALKAFTDDESAVVNACGLIAVTQYLEQLPHSVLLPDQAVMISAIGEYLSQHDLRDELEDSDDIKSALILALRDSIILDTSVIERSSALDYFFNLASNGAGNFMLSDLLVETFELIVQSVAEKGTDAYIRLCEKTIPSLTGAFHVGSMDSESCLTDFAAELASKLAEFGSDPLPAGFVSALMPPLQSILMQATEGSIVRPATTAVSHMLNKGTEQFLAWNHDGKSSVEICLTIVDRLISAPEMDETAAEEVGHLANSLVEKCGSEVLGSYLADLIRALAVRLGTAERIQFMQSLLMVFASLAITAPSDVVNFLGDININSQSALQVVLTKWLENSVHFAGYDEIRQNVMALSKIYALQDPRVNAITVKGDLIVVNDGRIKTRSRARQNPDTYTQIPASLKIVKLLIDELKNAAYSTFDNLASARAAAEALEDDEDGDSLASNDGDANDDWEDLATTGDGSLDLGSAKVREELMGLVGDGTGSTVGERIRDDQTTEYLINWFKDQANREEFNVLYAQLKPEEQKILQDLVR